MCFFLDLRNGLASLKLPCNMVPGNRPNTQKESSLPTIHFQVRTLSFREGIPSKKKSLATGSSKELTFQTLTIICCFMLFLLVRWFFICILCTWYVYLYSWLVTFIWVALESPHSFRETLVNNPKSGMFFPSLSKMCCPFCKWWRFGPRNQEKLLSALEISWNFHEKTQRMSSNKRDVKTNHGIKYGLLVGWITINSSITHLKFNRSTPFDLKKDPFFL